MKQITLLYIICAGALFMDNALAGTVTNLNNYSFSSTCESFQFAGSGCSLSNGSGNGNVQTGLSGLTGPFVTASNASTDAGGNTNGDLVYQILVQGPANTAQVDVSYLLNVTGQYSGLGNDEAAQLNTGATFTVGLETIGAASIIVNASGGSIENGFPPSLTDDSVNAGFSSKAGGWAGSLSGPQTISLTTGLSYNVELRLQADCTAQGKGSSSVSCTTSAMIDPTFTIDPDQLNAGQYSITLSPGVGNGSAAPEPGTLTLLGGGILGAVVLGRFRGRR
jgi:hypothetical protein